MPTENYEIVGSYNNQRFASLDAERSINLFEYVDPLSKKSKSLLSTSGLINAGFSLTGISGGVRAEFVFQNFHYVVIGPTVLRIDTFGNVITIGTLINTASGYVGIDANTFQVIFVDGVNGYIWDTIAATFKIISDTSFPPIPIDVCNLDGFFVVPHGGTNNFQLSQFNQGMVWGPATNTFTGSSATSRLTIVGGTANYATGVPVTLSVTGVNGVLFTAVGNELTLASTTEFSPTGTPIVVNPNTAAAKLPSPLAVSTTYFSIIDSPTTMRLATTKDNATAGIAITLTDTGTPPNAMGALPVPLLLSTTYFAINIDGNNIKLANSLSNAQSGTAITLTTDGTGTETILSSGQLQQGAVTSHPGTIVACRTLHRRLFFFSQFFTEIWENQGIGTNLPFRRNNNYLIEAGTPAIGSIASSFDTMLFLSQDRDGQGSVMQVNGTSPIPVSNRALDFQLGQYAAAGQVSDCRAFLVKENGLIFYRMNFTAANHTYVYDVTLSDPQQEQGKLWHEEETLAGNRHVAQTHAFFNGLNYVGHYSLPILYILDSNTFNNDEEAIPRRRIGRPIVPSGYQRTRIDRFQLDLVQGNISLLDDVPGPLFLDTENEFDLLTESGDFIITEQPFNFVLQLHPVVFLSISKDGGQTFGFQLKAPMGELGQRSYRTLWRKLGVIPRGQAFVPKIEFFTQSAFIVLGASWSYEVLPQ